MRHSFTVSIPPCHLRLGIIEALGVNVRASREDYLNEVNEEVGRLLDPEFIYPDHIRKGIRSLLRVHGFHPSGRNRPASEYLFKDLQGRGSFQPINNIVDINNHISLVTHIPASVVDLDKSGINLCLRIGLPGEEYVFNSEGQKLALKNLVVIARADEGKTPFASPIKDSHETKVFSSGKNILAVLYSSQNLGSLHEFEGIVSRYSELLAKEADATEIQTIIVEPVQ